MTPLAARRASWRAPVVASFFASLVVAGALLALDAPRARSAPDGERVRSSFAADDGSIELFEVHSELLTAFWGRPIAMRAGVVLPPGWSKGERWPVCYDIHGFGGSHRAASRRGPALLRAMKEDGYARMVYVFLDASCPMGHHELADSVNNGPWGRALTEELVPALEARFAPGATAKDRFLTGHSSGGWSSLWLQVTYPDFWNGTWSTAPDSVDFRDFTGIDIYARDNAYADADGNDTQLVRRGAEWRMSIREFVKRELDRGGIGGQWYSFDAVFSPRAADGTPMKMHDRATGAIDRAVVEHWKRYDIGLILRTRWDELGPRLRGKLHVYCGTLDTFRLEGAVRLLKGDLLERGSDAEVLLVPDRDHGTLFEPHAEHWPKGMLHHIHHAMHERWSGKRTPVPPVAPLRKKVLY